MSDDSHLQDEVTLAVIESIRTIRGLQVMLDEDLAELYGVETRVLNQAVRRNPARFPEDFMFRVTEEEWTRLRSQTVTSKKGRGGRRYPPHAFTQEGVAMLSSVLQSEQAVAVNVEIMRAFVRYRTFVSNHAELAARLKELELRFEKATGDQDMKLRMLAEAMRQLRDEVRKSAPPPSVPKPVGQVGFRPNDGDNKPKGRKS